VTSLTDDPRWRRAGLWFLIAFLTLCLWALIRPSGDLPPDIRVGNLLGGIAVTGQAPMSTPDGLRISAIRGPWVRLHFGPEDETGRWFHFDHVTAFTTR
jgi:hypothetical protein